jgi:hypothetical protein
LACPVDSPAPPIVTRVAPMSTTGGNPPRACIHVCGTGPVEQRVACWYKNDPPIRAALSAALPVVAAQRHLCAPKGACCNGARRTACTSPVQLSSPLWPLSWRRGCAVGRMRSRIMPRSELRATLARAQWPWTLTLAYGLAPSGRLVHVQHRVVANWSAPPCRVPATRTSTRILSRCVRSALCVAFLVRRSHGH